MSPEEVQDWAISKAREIILREGAALALSARDLNEDAISVDSTLLGAAIATAIIEAYYQGAKDRSAR